MIALVAVTVVVTLSVQPVGALPFPRPDGDTATDAANSADFDAADV